MTTGSNPSSAAGPVPGFWSPDPPGPSTGQFGPFPPRFTDTAPTTSTFGVLPEARSAPQPHTVRRRGGRLATVAFALAVLLLVLSGAQAYTLYRVNQRLHQATKSASADHTADADRIAALDARIKELERRAGNTLDAQAVAADVLPSVFKVTAGRFSGTAFAVTKDAGGASTGLITNFHVVASLYKGGGRDVALEQPNARFNAKIVKVDERKDLALLRVDQRFPTLATATDAAKPGESVVVVGAPLGLEQSITSGVISALRGTADEPMIQFDAAINPGSSGGPVINAQRKVVGIATLKAQNAEGIGLAIPIAVACQSLGIC